MEWRDRRSLALALVLAAISAHAQYCDKLYDGAAAGSAGERQVREQVARRGAVLVWGAPPAGAAAALLRAVLLAAGARPADVTLLQHNGTARLCSFLKCPTCNFMSDIPKNLSSRVVVVVATAWSAADTCAWDDDRAMRARYVRAAPLAARLHARLAPHYQNASACAAAGTWGFHRDAVARSACGFQRPGDKFGNIYVVENEWEAARQKLESRLNGSMRVVPIARVAPGERGESLAALVAAGNHSLLFLDAELWDDVPDIRVVPQPCAGTATACAPLDDSLTLAATFEYRLRVQAAPLRELLQRFTPRGSVLRAVLQQAETLHRGGACNLQAAYEEAACEWATAPEPARYRSEIAEWRKTVVEPFNRRALIYLCDPNGTEYDAALKMIGNYVNHETDATVENWKFSVEGCGRTKTDRDIVENFLEQKNTGILEVVAYVLAPARVATALAPFAATLGVPLLAYDVPPPAAGLRSAAGDVARLAAAVRALLTACGWGRLGVLSERSPVAEALTAALGASGAGVPPLTYEVRRFAADDDASVADALHELVDEQGARVVLVNGGAAAAGAVLRAADARDLTPERGFAWLVLEYEAENETTTARLRPCSVSYQRRGPGAARGGPGAARGGPSAARGGPSAARGALLAKLAALWPGRRWPRYAASLVDALLVLGHGYKRFMEVTSTNKTYKPEDKLRVFWAEVQREEIPGLFENITYKDDGIDAPRVFVEVWGANRSETSAAGECPLRRVGDGAAGACLARTGTAFRPGCADGAWAGGGAAAALALAAAVLAVRRVRRRRRRREALRRAKCEAELLSRWVRAFAGMGPRLVRRTALQLGDELGAGRFGVVRLAQLREPGRARPALVAAKALREGAAPEEEGQFLREACTLAALAHAHVVRFEGACVEGGPPLLLMEYAFFGNLRTYLYERRHLAESGAEDAEAAAVAPEELTRLACEAAEALAYLAAHGLVHRDVRAANCLVDARRRLKLADFGLARETGATDGEYACRSRAMFPVLWMAPESLALGVCSPASDVWSFGVLALEVVTLGERPYGAASAEAVMRLVLGGGRPPLPRDASAETRELVRECWRRVPAERPTPRALARRLASPAARALLRPALARQLEGAEVDSGFGEPVASAPELRRPSPAP